MTRDHTMGELGVLGPGANNLSRALGIAKEVRVDVILCKPYPGDIYLLCSDGLTRMVPDDAIASILRTGSCDDAAVELVRRANAGGGADNITVIVIGVNRSAAAAAL
jgi:protein phosphatase